MDIFSASQAGDYKIFQELAVAAAFINVNDEDSHSAIFDLLIQAGANLDNQNKKNQTELDLAVMFGRRNLIFKINQLQNSSRSDGKVEQIKTWAQKLV